MRRQEIQFRDLSNLDLRMTLLGEDDGSYFVIVMAFAGTYEYGSRGNGDGAFMCAMVSAALEAWAPFGLILDLRELHYEFGNTLVSAITAGRDDDSREWTTPTRIVTSPSSRGRLTTLLQYIQQDPREWLYDSIEDAYIAVRSLHDPL